MIPELRVSESVTRKKNKKLTFFVNNIILFIYSQFILNSHLQPLTLTLYKKKKLLQSYNEYINSRLVLNK